MSIIPAVPQPPRARSEAVPAPATERRNSNAHRTRFAESLANARTDRAPSREGTPTGCSRGAEHTDHNDGSDGSDGSHNATTKAKLSGQRRALLQDVMLRGAMKFAVTRNDASTNATSPDVSASQPAVIDIPAGERAAPIAPVLCGPFAPVADAVDECGSSPLSPIAPTVSDNPVLALPVPLQFITQSMPQLVTGVTDDLAWNDGSVAADSEADAYPVLPDMATSSAATVAAMQLVATLPIDVPLQSDTCEPDATAAATEPAAALTSGVSDAMVSNPIASQPKLDGTGLVEDHFDVPAAAFDVAAATSTRVIPPEPSSTGVATPTTAGASSGATRASTPVKPGAVEGADVTSLQSDLAKLDPEFRDRLQKVIDRMRQEFGHTVKVVETVRSQARQNALFAQGRTTPGQVVTWTKNSKHGKGLAADLMVDGAWQNPLGYAHLADVAKQEGLRTLGSRDAGHVEMPANGGVSGETLGNLLSDLQGDAGDSARQLRADVNTGVNSGASSGGGTEERASTMARISNMAQVARVAAVANVAQVAKVANVARPGAPAPGSDSISPLAVSAVPTATPNSDASGALRLSTPVSAVNMADRISHLMDLQATQDARPLNSVLLRMDNANGIEDQIRIDTRGTSVDARLGLGNAQQAAALTDRLGELRDALERRGLTADGVRVQVASASRATDSVNFSHATAPTLGLAAMRAAADSQAQGNTRDQSARDQAQRDALARDQSRHTPRSSSDDTRQRSRREQPEERR